MHLRAHTFSPTHTALPSTKLSGHPATSLNSFLPKQFGNLDSSLSFHPPEPERATKPPLLCFCCFDPLRLLSLDFSIPLENTCLCTPCIILSSPPCAVVQLFAPFQLCNTANQPSHALISLMLSTGFPANLPLILLGTVATIKGVPQVSHFNPLVLLFQTPSYPVPNPLDSTDKPLPQATVHPQTCPSINTDGSILHLSVKPSSRSTSVPTLVLVAAL